MNVLLRADVARCGPAPLFIGSDLFRPPAFGRNHPLAIPRLAVVMDLCRILGWLPAASFIASPPATRAELLRFHDAPYLDALQRAGTKGVVNIDERARFGLGTLENPVFPGLWERATTAAGGSLLAARRVLAGGIAFNPAGGAHHGRRDRASGFCYLNDPVLAVLALLHGGMERVLYVDLDAHHGDGVEAAFTGEPRVLLVSIHEEKRWPFSGDRDRDNARNFAVPPGFHDAELDILMEAAVLPLAARFAPQAVVVTCGADGLAGDPLSKMALSNGALWRAVLALAALSPRTVVLGGGGYNPWTLARCWTGLWGRLSGHAIPARLPTAAEALLRGLSCDLVEADQAPDRWFTTLEDPPNAGAVRAAVRALADAELMPLTRARQGIVCAGA